MSKKGRKTRRPEPADDRKDLYTRLTERSIAELEQGIRT
jgi:antirestriction protein ArdC